MNFSYSPVLREFHQGHQHPPALPAHQHAAGSPDGQSPERPHGHTKSKIRFYWLDRSYKQTSIRYMFKTINYSNCNILSFFFFFSITTVLRTSVLEGDVCVMATLRPVMLKIPTIHTSKWLIRSQKLHLPGYMCNKKLYKYLLSCTHTLTTVQKSGDSMCFFIFSNYLFIYTSMQQGCIKLIKSNWRHL